MKFIRRPCGGLTKRQLAVIEDLFAGELDEQTVLDKHKVSRRLYNKWLADDVFAGEFDRRIESAFRQSAALIARYAPFAAAKLVQLTESDKEETARKACLDILLMHTSRTRDDGRDSPVPVQPAEGGFDQAGFQPVALPDQTASRLLSALAQPEQQQTEND